MRMSVEEVTLDFSESMHSIVERCFPNAMRTQVDGNAGGAYRDSFP